jgi:hypothetical protein
MRKHSFNLKVMFSAKGSGINGWCAGGKIISMCFMLLQAKCCISFLFKLIQLFALSISQQLISKKRFEMIERVYAELFC